VDRNEGHPPRNKQLLNRKGLKRRYLLLLLFRW
jgi:hypothetical protein